VHLLKRGAHMKSLFSFENFPLTFVIGLVVLAWLSFLSVITFG